MFGVSGQVSHFNNFGISRRAGLYFLADGFAFFAVGAHAFVVELEVHPHAGGDAEEAAQAQIVSGGAAAFTLFHLGKVGRGNATAAGDLRLGQVRLLKRFAEGLGEEVEQRDELRFLLQGVQFVTKGFQTLLKPKSRKSFSLTVANSVTPCWMRMSAARQS